MERVSSFFATLNSWGGEWLENHVNLENHYSDYCLYFPVFYMIFLKAMVSIV